MLFFIASLAATFPGIGVAAWTPSSDKSSSTYTSKSTSDFLQVVAKPDGNPCTNDEYDKKTGETWYIPIPGCCHVPDGGPQKRWGEGDGDGHYHHHHHSDSSSDTWGGGEHEYEGQCDDGDPCTVDTCNAETHQCVHEPRGPSQDSGLGECCASDADCPKEQCLPGVCQKEGDATHGFCVTERVEAAREGGCCVDSAECCPFEMHDAQSGVSLELGICDYACQCVFVPRSEGECRTTEDCKGTVHGQKWLAEGPCHKLECFGRTCKTYICDPATTPGGCDSDDDGFPCDSDCDDHDSSVGAPIYCIIDEEQPICGALDCNEDVWRTCEDKCPDGYRKITPEQATAESISCENPLPDDDTMCSIVPGNDIPCIDVPEGLTETVFCGDFETCNLTFNLTFLGEPVFALEQNCSCTVREFCALECPAEQYNVTYDEFDPAEALECEEFNATTVADPLQECFLEPTSECPDELTCPPEQRIGCLIDGDNDTFPDCTDCNILCLPSPLTKCPEGYVNLLESDDEGERALLNETQPVGTCSMFNVIVTEYYNGTCDCCDCDEYAYPGSPWTSCQPTRCEVRDTPASTPEPTQGVPVKRWGKHSSSSSSSSSHSWTYTSSSSSSSSSSHSSSSSSHAPTCDWAGEGALIHDYDCNGDTERFVCCPEEAVTEIDEYGRILYDKSSCKSNVSQRCGYCDGALVTEGWECEESCDSGHHDDHEDGPQKRRKKECPEPVDGDQCQCKCVEQGEWPDVCECAMFIDHCVQIGAQPQKRSFFSEGDQCCLVTMQ